MVSALKWEAASTSNTLVSSGASLANSTISAASTAYDNRTNLNTYGWLELTGTFSVAPSASNPVLNVYFAESADGTNYQDAPLTGGSDQGEMFVIAIPVQKVTSAQRIVVGPVALSPNAIKAYVDNQTGQTMSSTWTLKLYTNNLEGQ